MNPKMLIMDLDGTLLHSDGSISKRTKAILKRCKGQGIFVVIATARYWIGAERYIKELQPDYEITTDGTLIHRHGHEIYSCSHGIVETNRIIQDIFAWECETEITVASGRQVFWNSRHISESEKLHKAVYCDYSKPLTCRANKIVAMLPDDKTALKIAEKNHCRLQGYRGEKWYAFLPESSGKVQAIRKLTDMLHISLNEVVAFGDDKNDIDMLKLCGTGVAVENAISDVKNIADHITLTNNEDGVAMWLEKNVLSDW